MALYLKNKKIASGSAVNITVLDDSGNPDSSTRNIAARASFASPSNVRSLAPFIDFKSELDKNALKIVSGYPLTVNCFVSAFSKKRGIKYQFAVDDVVIAEQSGSCQVCLYLKAGQTPSWTGFEDDEIRFFKLA